MRPESRWLPGRCGGFGRARRSAAAIRPHRQFGCGGRGGRDRQHRAGLGAGDPQREPAGERCKECREELAQHRSQFVVALGASPDRVLVPAGQHGDGLAQLAVGRQCAVQVSVDAQDVGQRHGIGMVGLRPCHRMAFPVASHRQRVYRIHRPAGRAQRRDHRPRGVSIATGIGSSALSPAAVSVSTSSVNPAGSSVMRFLATSCPYTNADGNITQNKPDGSTFSDGVQKQPQPGLHHQRSGRGRLHLLQDLPQRRSGHPKHVHWQVHRRHLCRPQVRNARTTTRPVLNTPRGGRAHRPRQPKGMARDQSGALRPQAAFPPSRNPRHQAFSRQRAVVQPNCRTRRRIEALPEDRDSAGSPPAAH